MEQLIPIINSLQDVFATLGDDFIDLPQIAVLGSQSSGKSSVLEAIVGRDFLPRGSGIVTRRPLVLRLTNTPATGGSEPVEYGEFTHLPGQRFYNFEDIMNEISAETEKAVGPTKNVTKEPIFLQIWSPHVLNLTLVDLPGITKVSVQGQDPSVVKDIHDMVFEQVSKPSTLILAIIPANDDIANSDALRMAREVDPTGDRTIGVVTKIDLMGKGTNCREILENRIYPLKLGYIGVVNRSQQDINDKVPIEVARKHEKEYFENHRDYSDLSDRCGISYLSIVLNRLLMEHIRTCLPSLRSKIQSMLAEKEAELEGYGSDPTQSAGTTNAFVLEVITKYLDNFQALLEGRLGRSHGGSSISQLFISNYMPKMEKIKFYVKSNTPEKRHGDEKMTPREKLKSGLDSIKGSLSRAKEALAPKSDKDKVKAFLKKSDTEFPILLRNHTGIEVPLFTPNDAFHVIIARSIEELRKPSLELIDKVVAKLFKIHDRVEFMELSRFGALAGAIRAAVDDCVRRCIRPTQDFVNGLIDNEKSLINTMRPDYRGIGRIDAERAPHGVDPRSRALPRPPPTPDPVGVCSLYGSAKKSSSASREAEGEENEQGDLITLASNYFDLVNGQIADLVPKAIVKILVNGSTKLLRPTMIETVFNSIDLQSLLVEETAITKKRVACQQAVTALKKAQQILNTIRTVKI